MTAFRRKRPPGWSRLNGNVATAAHLLDGRLHTSDSPHSSLRLCLCGLHRSGAAGTRLCVGADAALCRRSGRERLCALYASRGSLPVRLVSVRYGYHANRSRRAAAHRTRAGYAAPARRPAGQRAGIRRAAGAGAARQPAHVELSAALLAFQADLCDMCGGALVRIASGCRCRGARTGIYCSSRSCWVRTLCRPFRHCLQASARRRRSCVFNGPAARRRWPLTAHFPVRIRICSGDFIWTERKFHKLEILFALLL